MKDKLKKNAFGLGLAAGVVVIVAFFFLFVWSAMSQRDQLKNTVGKLKKDLEEIKSKGPEMPSDVKLEDFQKLKEQLGQSLAACKDWYKKYDRSLELWFRKFPEGQDPAIGQFAAEYEDRQKGLEKDLEDKGVQVGIEMPQGAAPGFAPGGAPRSGLKLKWEDPNAMDMKVVQKRFWIRERVKNALLALKNEAKDSVVALEEVRFLPDPGGAPASGDDYLGWPQSSGGGAAPEYDLKGGYGKVITCGVRALIYYPHVPKLLRLLLDTDGVSPPMLVHLRGARVAITEPLDEEIPITIQVLPNTPAQEVQALRQKALDEHKPAPRPIRVLVTLEVFDFDGAKLAAEFKAPGAQ